MKAKKDAGQAAQDYADKIKRERQQKTQHGGAGTGR